MLTRERTVCNLCKTGGSFENAAEIARVNCNVRKFRDRSFTVWRCTGCHSIHSKDSVDLDLYYQYYPSIQRGEAQPPDSAEVEIQSFEKLIFKNRIRPFSARGFSKDARILDYGCNRGSFVIYLRELGYSHVRGYDPYHAAWKDESVLRQKFDVITLQDVIEHVENPRELLRTLTAMLADNGLLIVGTPNADEIDLKYANTTANLELHQPYHRQIFSEGALVQLGGETGLRAVHVSHRWSLDTPVPFVNGSFLANYVLMQGNIVDSIITEAVEFKSVLRSPRLLMYGLFGYYLRRRGNMEIVFSREPSP